MLPSRSICASLSPAPLPSSSPGHKRGPGRPEIVDCLGGPGGRFFIRGGHSRVVSVLNTGFLGQQEIADFGCQGGPGGRETPSRRWGARCPETPRLWPPRIEQNRICAPPRLRGKGALPGFESYSGHGSLPGSTSRFRDHFVEPIICDSASGPEIGLPGWKSGFRPGFRPESNRASFKIGPSAGFRPAGVPIFIFFND